MAGYKGTEKRDARGRWVKSDASPAKKGVNTGEMHGPRQPAVVRAVNRVASSVGAATSRSFQRLRDQPATSVTTRDASGKFYTTSFAKTPPGIDNIIPAGPKPRRSGFGSASSTVHMGNTSVNAQAGARVKRQRDLQALLGGVQGSSRVERNLARDAAIATGRGAKGLLGKIAGAWKTQKTPTSQSASAGVPALTRERNPNFARPPMVFPQKQRLSASMIDAERMSLMSNRRLMAQGKRIY